MLNSGVSLVWLVGFAEGLKSTFPCQFWAHLFYKEPLPEIGGGALRAHPADRPARNPLNLTHATIALAFYPKQVGMPNSWEAVSSQTLLRRVKRTPLFRTSPFFHVSRPQRLSPLASIPAIRRITDADSVTVFAKLYLPSSYAFAPRHLQTYSAPASERSY